MSKKEPGWKDIPIGGLIVEAGNAENYKTGGWRIERPEIEIEKCINCLNCWVYCPDSAVILKDGKVTGFDLAHCKGCAICAENCPPKIKCIKMVKED